MNDEKPTDKSAGGRHLFVDNVECIDFTPEGDCIACFEKLLLFASKVAPAINEKHMLPSELATTVKALKRARPLQVMPTTPAFLAPRWLRGFSVARHFLFVYPSTF